MNKSIPSTGNYLDSLEVLNQITPLVGGKTRVPKSSKDNIYVKIDNTERVKITTARTLLFINKGVECVCCGVVANKVIVEKDYTAKEDKWFLGFYVVKNNVPVRMLTIDHITPKSKMGSVKSMTNLQPMCDICNNKKGNKC